MTDVNLLQLPVDVLYLIFGYLDVPSFVSLTATCKALQQSDLTTDPAFWSSAVRSTFRVPNQPVVQHDGRRWRNLYKRLLTQTRAYTWGKNDQANLGHSYMRMDEMERLPPAERRRQLLRARNISWPTEMEEYRHLGIIADLQAGGFSTSFLTSKGAIYMVGVMDGLRFVPRPRPDMFQRPRIRPTALQYPPGFPHPSERYEPTTAISQFSSGRMHVLGLADSGRIWSWNSIEQAGLNVKFLNVDITEHSKGGPGTVKKVVAGWGKSAALVVGSGIVIWDPLKRGTDETEIEDAALVLESVTVPNTGSLDNAQGANRATTISPEDAVNFIILENYVVYQTREGQIFGCKIFWSRDEQRVGPAVEVPLHSSSEASRPETEDGRSPNPYATDLQGSFRNFAIFTNTGAVLTVTQDHLEHLGQNPGAIDSKPLIRVPALQNNGVIALAFGDYHFHALHASGTITSYGCEPQGCGALGLGGSGPPEGRLRGIRYSAPGGDGKLIPHAYTRGRQVWFEPEKKDWICFLVSGAKDPGEARERLRMCSETNVQGEVSEWVEQEGRAWEEKYAPKMETSEAEDAGSQDETVRDTEDEAGSKAYFALSVTAAGWQSGALVLVNEERANSIWRGCTVPSTNRSIFSSDATSAPDEQSLLSRAAGTVSWLASYIPFNPFAQQTEDNGNTRPVPPQSPGHFSNPVNHGAALDANTPYKWAGDSFPRLRLSGGREMPGEVDFDDWKLGRPEWDLGFQYYQ